MKRLWPLLLLAGCAPALRPLPRLDAGPPAPVATRSAPGCQTTPDGSMPGSPQGSGPATATLADRGIGGTGAVPGERGIGGTGRLAERGIGGTGATAANQDRQGIVGVITGFASVCLAGQEIGLAPGQTVLIDGRPMGPDRLRIGQVAAIEAAGSRAVALVIRHEVSGPVERIEPDGSLRIAGQRVMPPPSAPGIPPMVPAVGAWVEVSGFRRVDGAITATRLDPRGPGETLLRGVMRPEAGRLWIGLTEIRPGRGQFRAPGVPVLAIGRLNGGVLEADTVEPDALLVDPGAYFGNRVGVLLIEGYAEGGAVRFGLRGYGFAGGPIGRDGRALARLERGPGGYAPVLGGGFGPASRLEPAPTPNRTFDRPGAPGVRQGRGLDGGGFRRPDPASGRGGEPNIGNRRRPAL